MMWIARMCLIIYYNCIALCNNNKQIIGREELNIYEQHINYQ